MLEVKHISFSWGRAPLLDDVSFTVAPGETVALAGANGAGKTTLLRILAGVCLPSSGTVVADAADMLRAPMRYRRLLGYLPESAPVEPGMTVKGYLKYRANLKGEMQKKIRHRVLEAMELCGLEARADARVDNLSQGLRKRVALADAILLRPRFLLLDDLLAGLDAETRISVGRILKSVSSFAATIVSGHELDELQGFATKFLVLKDGRIIGAKTAAGVRTVLTAVPSRKGEGEAVR
jgi:ABC-2 type transport system ATP-binding protein